MSSTDLGGLGGDRLNDRDLVAGFRQGEVSGQDVMKRLLGKIGLAHRGQKALVRKDGSPLIGDDGDPIVAEEYLSVAVKHPPAVPVILGFVEMDEGSPKFPDARAGVFTIVSGYLPPETPTSHE